MKEWTNVETNKVADSPTYIFNNNISNDLLRTRI